MPLINIITASCGMNLEIIKITVELKPIIYLCAGHRRTGLEILGGRARI